MGEMFFDALAASAGWADELHLGLGGRHAYYDIIIKTKMDKFD